MNFACDTVPTGDTRSRFARPRNPKRWYQCRCGRWWGINKSTFCFCGAVSHRSRARTSVAEQARLDRDKARVLDALDHHEWAAYVRGFLP